MLSLEHFAAPCPYLSRPTICLPTSLQVLKSHANRFLAQQMSLRTWRRGPVFLCVSDSEPRWTRLCF